MANTFTCLNYHVVFSTKYRKPLITIDLRDELYNYIGGIIRAHQGCLHEIGGIADHVHLLVGISPTVPVSDMVRLIKANSSKWVSERGTRFQWQRGFSAFSVSYSQIEMVRRYIQNQAEHHRSRAFKDEYLEMLKRHGIEFDLRYVFEDEHVG